MGDPMLGYLFSFSDRPSLSIAPGSADLHIGRAPDQDIVIDDPAVSRAHARLFWRNGYLYLEDLGSKHGTHVNGSRLTEPHRLADHDEIQFGQFSLRSERIQTPSAGDLSEESTLVLPVEGLRNWLRQKTGHERFPDWPEALDLLHVTSLWMLNATSSREYLSYLLGRLFDLLEARRGAVLMAEHEQLVPVAERTSEDVPPLRLSPATLEAALHRREAVLITEPHLKGWGGAGTKTGSTVMAVPMEHEGEVLGVFYFDTIRARGPFTEDDLRFVASLGNLVAAKLVHLRMAEALREQERLEQELHAAEALAQAKGEFLAHMSHEIRTPMNAVLGFAHLARKQPIPPQADHYLQRIETAGQTLLEILNDILDMSKIEAGKLEVESTPFMLQEVVEQSIGFVDLTAAEKGLDLESQVDALVPARVVGDPLRLRQCLINLLSNAVKFTERGGIQLRTKVLGRQGEAFDVSFSITDTGIGLSPEELQKVFLPFEQAEAGTTRRYGGTGLGLAITRRLAEAMGGELSVTSEKGSGSTFTLRIPLVAAVPAPTQAPAARREPRNLAGLRVLLAEDHPLNRELLRTLLEEVGCRVDVAADGLEALEAARSKPFDVILLDVEMPGMDGLEVARRIRTIHVNQRKPILALTAHALPEYRDRCLEAGMDVCLTKPIEPARLFATLAEWILPEAEPEPEPKGVPSSWAPLEPVMDVRLALGWLMEREDLLERFITSFTGERERLGQILAALQGGQTAEGRRLTHGLKGIAATLALTGVTEASGRLEEALIKGDVPWEPLYDRLREEMDVFLAAASVFLARRS